MAEENVTAVSSAESTSTDAATEATVKTETAATTESNAEQVEKQAFSMEDLERIIQSRVDKSNSEYGKKIAELKKENSKLKKEKLSEEELKNFEISEKEKELAAREKDLLDRENRLYAIKAIKEIGLDDGSEKSLALVDFVMASEQSAIDEKVKAFNDLVQSIVSARVDQKFKAIGRTPNGAATQQTETKKETSIAENLGKRKAEQMKQSNAVLDMYLGGKK